MREESQLEEMRAALRGDRERSELARRRSEENVRALVEAPARVEESGPKRVPGGLRGLFRRR